MAATAAHSLVSPAAQASTQPPESSVKQAVRSIPAVAAAEMEPINPVRVVPVAAAAAAITHPNITQLPEQTTWAAVAAAVERSSTQALAVAPASASSETNVLKEVFVWIYQ